MVVNCLSAFGNAHAHVHTRWTCLLKFTTHFELAMTCFAEEDSYMFERGGASPSYASN